MRPQSMHFTAFFDTLRAEHFQDQIAVTMICPGFIRTNVSVNALTADGSRLGKMDEAQAKGMSPEACASEIFKAITRKKRRSQHRRKRNAGGLCKTVLSGNFLQNHQKKQKSDKK
ncbi:hypothetical protein [Algoriphagus boritolerans]|uniref:hypothetical protein n=1 Tax=Algoriphagus boritolerans TaxID=308111 RepID=UPI002FCE42D8